MAYQGTYLPRSPLLARFQLALETLVHVLAKGVSRHHLAPAIYLERERLLVLADADDVLRCSHVSPLHLRVRGTSRARDESLKLLWHVAAEIALRFPRLGSVRL